MLLEVRVPWPSLAEVERRFDEILRSCWGGAVEAPPADLFVAADEVHIEMDLPGVSEDDIRVRVERHGLIIKGQRVHAWDEQSRPGALARGLPTPLSPATRMAGRVARSWGLCRREAALRR